MKAGYIRLLLDQSSRLLRVGTCYHADVYVKTASAASVTHRATCGPEKAVCRDSVRGGKSVEVSRVGYEGAIGI